MDSKEVGWFTAFVIAIVALSVGVLFASKEYDNHCRMNKKAVLEARWDEEFDELQMLMSNLEDVERKNQEKATIEVVETKEAALQNLDYAQGWLRSVRGRLGSKDAEEEDHDLEMARQLIREAEKKNKELNEKIQAFTIKNAESPK
mgnify:CR=1 FL=1